MKKIIILLAITISFNFYAQNKSNNFKLGVILSLDNNLSSENVIFDEYTGYSADYNKTNYKIGLSAEYELNKNLSLNSGINYSNKNFTGTYYCAVCNFLVPPSPEKVELEFVEIPISIRYYFLSTKLQIFADIGLSNQLSLNNKLNNGLNKESVVKEYILSGKLGGGFEYYLNKKFAIQFITEYNKGLTNLFQETNFKIDSFSFGLGFVKKL